MTVISVHFTGISENFIVSLDMCGQNITEEEKEEEQEKREKLVLEAVQLHRKSKCHANVAGNQQEWNPN